MWLPLALLPIFACLFWFIVVVPQRRAQQAHQAIVDSVSPGDEIVTAGGIHGRVIALDGEVMEIEVAASTVLRMDRQAISAVLSGAVAPTEDAS